MKAMLWIICALLALTAATAELPDYRYYRAAETNGYSQPVWITLDAAMLDATQSQGADIRVLAAGRELPYHIEFTAQDIPIAAAAASSERNMERGERYGADNLIDGSWQTFYQNDYLAEPTQTTIELQLAGQHSLSSISIELQQSVENITVYALNQGRRTLLEQGSSATLNLHNVRAEKLALVIGHTGTLRISEITLQGSAGGRLLVNPGNQNVRIYYGKPNAVKATYNTTALFTTVSTPTVSLGAQQSNPSYLPPRDGLADNCPLLNNPDQKDTDNDGVGDACDSCRSIQNADQSDSDADGIGDACDNCRWKPNADQLDTDLDGIGWVCDDEDRDGITNERDNCLNGYNPDQQDVDRDGIGDVCEDDDGDGIATYLDLCPLQADATNTDSDKDGRGDVCDNCISLANPDQRDDDGNAVGNACEDPDKDGVFALADNCPLIANADQVDWDNDGLGDACDNCPEIRNADQQDNDRDGIGNVCDGEESRILENPTIVWSILIIAAVLILAIAFGMRKN